MSMDKTLGTWVFECDICGDELDTHEEDFGYAVAVKKKENWGSRKERHIGHSEWLDLCPTCKIGYCNGIR